MGKLAGLHHVTAIAGDPQRNIDFYAGFLGLRLVKVTVNFDAPDTYHFYYGDGMGHPGTLLTFFPQAAARRGRKGVGQASIVAFHILPEAITFWMERLRDCKREFEGPIPRSDRTVLTFFDPDDLQVELVAAPEAPGREPWSEGPIPPAYGLRGLYGITLITDTLEPTAGFLTQGLGFSALGDGPNHRYHFSLDAGSAPASPAYLDLLVLPGMAPGRMGTGAIHHVAWRTPGLEDQLTWRQSVLDQPLSVTPVLDRKYFRSFYFREPGGVLFEIATDGPGFTVDEEPDELGTALQLPAHLEARRGQIEAALPSLRLPAAGLSGYPAHPVNL